MGRFSCRFPSRCFASTIVWVVSVVNFRVVVLRQPSYVSFQLSISESLFCVNRHMCRFSCRFPSRCFASTVVSVVDFRVVVLQQPSYGSFQLSISESLFCGNRCMGRFSCRFPSRCFAATVVWVISVVGFQAVVLQQPSYRSFQLLVSESLFCGNRRMGRFSCRFPSRCFAATVVWVVSVVGFRVVLRQPSYGSFQLSISESLFCVNRRFSCRFPSRCFAATVVWVVSVVDFRVVVLRQPLYGSFQLSISESLFCGNRRMGHSVVGFQAVVLQQPSYGSFQLLVSESLFCGNRRMGRFSCRFPSRCFAATVVWVVSVVGFRVVLRQPSYGSFQLSISESLFCGNRCMGRFSCRFPSRCFAATVVWVISVVGFQAVVLQQPSYGSFQLLVSESLFCGNRRMGRFSCRFPSRCFAATVVWVVSVVGFRVVLRQPSYGSFQFSISESLFCVNHRMGRFSCQFLSRCFASTVICVVSVVDFRVVVLRQPSYVSFQLSISDSLFCVNRRFSCRFPSRCFAATVVWVVSVVDFRVVVLRQPSYGSFQLSISESLFCGNRRMGHFSCRFPSRCFAATVVWVVSVVGFRVVVLRQPSYG